MKKMLLSAAVLAAFGANAQEACFVNPECMPADYTEDQEFPAGTLLCENDAAALYTYYGDTKVALKGATKNPYTQVQVNGGEILDLKGNTGIGGNSNPTFQSYESGIPTGGWVFKVTAKKSGYITLFGQFNSNKQYLVMAGQQIAIPYTLGVALTSGEKLYFSQPEWPEGDEKEYTINFTENPVLAAGPQYFITATMQEKRDGVPVWVRSDTGEEVVAATKPTVPEGESYKWNPKNIEIPGENKPQMPWISGGFDAAAGDGTGFIQFQLHDGLEYAVCALGSKWITNGFIYTEDAYPALTFINPADDAANIQFGEISGVNDITAPASLDENAPIYNVQGMQVSKDAKGILIQNGKKFVRF